MNDLKTMQQINSQKDFQKILDIRKSQTKQIVEKMAGEVVEREWDLLELNLFVSACGKDNLDMCNNRVVELRKRVSKGEINLTRYEDMAEEF